MSQAILEVRDLEKGFGGVKALNGLSLAIAPGELVCIIGPNGAGKSTFFKLLMGLEMPSAGRIFFRGRDITRLPLFKRARLGLGIKFQNMNVYQELSVYQNLFIPLRRHHKPDEIRQQIGDLLQQLHLAGTEDEPVQNLSHGQQQWLAIGMSIALEPEVLLLDEPAAGMSPEETRATAAIVKRLNRQGVTVGVIEHDMMFIRSLNARTTVLHHGRLFAEGTYEDIERNEDVHRIYLGKV
ncbi:MAG: ATP-binding cassette domain-containing protein [Rhodospirillales bacterium]